MNGSIDLILIGNISTEPVQRITGENTVTNFNVAVNIVQGGVKKVVYYRVAAWNKLSDVVSNYAHKGDPIKVYTHWIQPSVYNGEAQLEVNAQSITLLGSKRENANAPAQTESTDIPF
ncbi:MAG: single-stranded DNA-binding protein [Chloroflexota bacterium]